MIHGYQIRKVNPTDAGAIAKVHVDSWRTTYRGIVPDDFLDGMSYAVSEARWRRISAQNAPDYAMFVAEDEDGSIIGFANGGRERSGDADYDGELYAIYLLQAHQRRGIGRALFQNIVQHLVVNGFRSMLIWVLEDNPACRFYESMGVYPFEKPMLKSVVRC
ncbi:putative N-acetyltransferase YuaI [Alicyclobacillus contaminans]|nr:putative N-acetyltransferase YuaI [Alicyclobacillus contaminans]